MKNPQLTSYSMVTRLESSKIRNKKMFVYATYSNIYVRCSHPWQLCKRKQDIQIERKKQNYLCLQKTIIYVETPK